MSTPLSSVYGRKLAPTRRTKTPFGFKGKRQTIVVTHNPSTIEPGQMLLVRFPTLSNENVVVPGSCKLLFDSVITSTDDNARFVRNVGRAVIKKLSVRLQGKEVLSTDDVGIINCYRDLWMTPTQRQSQALMGIDDTASQNLTKLRSQAADATQGGEGASQYEALKTTFAIPLDNEILTERGPFHPSSLGDRLEFEITFNESSQVVIAAGDTGAKYSITNISLEYETVASEPLSREISADMRGRFTVLYERVHRHRRFNKRNEDTAWEIDINQSSRSLRGVVILANDATNFNRQSEKFLPFNVKKVEVVVEGMPNEIYSQGMLPRHFWHEAQRLFAGSVKEDTAESNGTAAELALSYITPEKYYKEAFALCIDMRSIRDGHIHGSGRALKNTGEGVVLRISRTAGLPGDVDLAVFIIQDGQMNIENGRLVDAIW